MTLILGTEYCKVDSNGRFKFPIALKKQLETEDCTIAIRQCPVAKCLEIWTAESFKKEAEELRHRLNPYSIKDNQMYLKLTQVNLADLDSNDRLMVPAERRWILGGSKQIVLHGVGNCIQLWEQSEYDKLMGVGFDENYAEVVSKRLGGNDGVPCSGDAE